MAVNAYDTPAAEQLSRVVIFDPSYTEANAGRYPTLAEAYAVADWWQRKLGGTKTVVLLVGNVKDVADAARSLVLASAWNPNVLLIGLDGAASALKSIAATAALDLAITGRGVLIESVGPAKDVTLNGIEATVFADVAGAVDVQVPGKLWDRTNQVLRRLYIEDNQIVLEDLPA